MNTNTSLETSFAKYIEKNAKRLHAIANESSADLSLLWGMLVYIFDFNGLYVYDTDDGCRFRRMTSLHRDPEGDRLSYDQFESLMKTACADDKPVSTQKEATLHDDVVSVEAMAAIPLVIDGQRKILVLFKKLQVPRGEVVVNFVFNSYQLELYLSVITVFTRAHEQERQLLHSEKLAMLGTLTAGIAHEINNPLSTIITKLVMLQGYVEDFKNALMELKQIGQPLPGGERLVNADFIIERLEKSIHLPLEMAERMRQIVASLKRYAAVDQGEIELVDVNQLLEEALEIVHHKVKHKAEVVKSYGQGLKKIRTSRNRLNQVLVNVLDNAADAIKDYGQIRIKTRQGNGDMLIQIANDGEEITKENLKKIFTPFFTTKRGGLGIGLYISHRIIHELGGAIEVIPEKGRGTNFTIKLPLQKENLNEKT
jgi:signal transduction histidine kinase